jgi:hypothetical protein
MSSRISIRNETNKEPEKPTVSEQQLTPQQVDTFEILQAQFDSLYEEMQTLAKKSPNDAINKFKLGLINLLLGRANLYFKDLNISSPFNDFKNFHEDQLPFNSDVLLIISQYIACLEKFRADHISNKYMDWYWIIDGIQSNKRTAPPKKLGN